MFILFLTFLFRMNMIQNLSIINNSKFFCWNWNFFILAIIVWLIHIKFIYNFTSWFIIVKRNVRFLFLFTLYFYPWILLLNLKDWRNIANFTKKKHVIFYNYKQIMIINCFFLSLLFVFYISMYQTIILWANDMPCIYVSGYKIINE